MKTLHIILILSGLTTQAHARDEGGVVPVPGFQFTLTQAPACPPDPPGEVPVLR
ncbi:hypothetical protein [Deinococcus depolymerans]|uniref:Uncharacterized protein n=1 Tax=Deinococcus depolymerans TaxID=392408 RepID=A0ABP3M6H2_9DEIO